VLAALAALVARSAFRRFGNKFPNRRLLAVPGAEITLVHDAFLAICELRFRHETLHLLRRDHPGRRPYRNCNGHRREMGGLSPPGFLPQPHRSPNVCVIFALNPSLVE
jgi:hypothetical protein